MDILKLTSIRLSKSVLGQAAKLGHEVGYYRTSDVLRVAIWVGLKFLTPGVLHRFLQLMWQEEFNGVSYNAWDVIRTAGEELEKLKNVE